jgi:hypothetical protein
MIEIYVSDTLTYTSNVALSNTMTWTANSVVVNLDYNYILDANGNNIGILTSNLSPIITNLPNTINYLLTVTANSNQTSAFLANTVNPAERVLILQTQFLSNTGLVQHANSQFLRIKNVDV